MLNREHLSHYADVTSWDIVVKIGEFYTDLIDLTALDENLWIVSLPIMLTLTDNPAIGRMVDML